MLMIEMLAYPLQCYCFLHDPKHCSRHRLAGHHGHWHHHAGRHGCWQLLAGCHGRRHLLAGRHGRRHRRHDLQLEKQREKQVSGIIFGTKQTESLKTSGTIISIIPHKVVAESMCRPFPLADGFPVNWIVPIWGRLLVEIKA